MSQLEINEDTLEEHDLAAMFPRMTSDEIEELADGMMSSGVQRDDIVIFDGKILDGRHTRLAVKLAGMTPRYRQYDEATEGPAWKYVRDRNLLRRNLDASQRAAIVSGMLRFSDAHAGTVAELAAAADVSTRTMTDAIAAETGGLGDDVRSGKKSASGAAKQARAAKTPKAPKPKKPPEGDDEATAKLRAEKESDVKKTHGDHFARAFANGTVLKKGKEIKEFLKMEPSAQKGLVPYLAEGWTLEKAVRFHTRDLATDDTIETLILRVTANGGKPFRGNVAGHEITIKRLA